MSAQPSQYTVLIRTLLLLLLLMQTASAMHGVEHHADEETASHHIEHCAACQLLQQFNQAPPAVIPFNNSLHPNRTLAQTVRTAARPWLNDTSAQPRAPPLTHPGNS